ncbi:ATPase [Methylobacterium sp. J-088]|uniref:ATPase n=1 Tax=unclassified Methylobacterium TaxID=2615210 RepID=UPI001FB8B5B2|nr:MULTISPECIES: ATPase [unclassified Methylobacterium]MCJ2066586.1 ATPase [Methylobacterium sp. J-088]
MSEPARSLPPESSGRPAPGPLRDWLSAMKTHSPADAARPDQKAGPGAAETAWSPRVVAPAGPSQAAETEDADISELMAENLMLKAKLRLEAEHQDQLQALLAEEIRTLRAHIQDEIGSLDDLRAEQAEIRAERERFKTERAATQAERERAAGERSALMAERDALREERDVWRARTEALAQPLFQMQKR